MQLKSKLFKTIFLSLFLLTSSYAKEDKEQIFLGADFSISNGVANNACKDSDNKTLFGSIKAGYNLTSPIRVYASFTPIKWDYARANLMELNGDYIHKLNDKFSLFGGVSIGYTNLKGSFSGKSSKYNSGLKAGVIYKLAPKLNLEASYKFIDTNSIKAIHNQNFISLDNFNIFNLGVSYNF